MNGLLQPLPLTAAARQIQELATALAEHCLRQVDNEEDQPLIYSRLLKLAQAHEVDSPTFKGDDLAPALVRFSSSDWWRRKLSTAHGKRVERNEIHCGKVHRFAQLYVSDQTLKRLEFQKSKNLQFIDRKAVVNELGEEYDLIDMVGRSTANPENQRAELMARISGFEKIAQDSGDVGLFLTFTCPSKMHARLHGSGRPNPAYDGTAPDQAQTYLNNVWARIRAKLKRDGVCCYGARISEPQHDGTPHWHLLIFTADRNAGTLKQVCKRYNLAESNEETGAKRHRVKCVPIDWNRGTAAGYVAKYIAKNIDGVHIQEDSHGMAGTESAKRVKAWASVWSIRQFQFFGGPPVQLWRELRMSKDDGEGVISEAYGAADAGDWAEFVRITGGPVCTRKDRLIWLDKVWSDERNRYDEPKGYQVWGVESAESKLRTRHHSWKIVDKRAAYGAQRSAAA